jgi:hypothetical protein
MAVETLTVVSAIGAGHEQHVREALEAFGDGDDSPFADVPGTHVARFVVMNRLATGDPTHRQRLRPSRLLFSAVIDGPAEAWLWGLFEKQGPALEKVWCHCIGWPDPAGSTDSTARVVWLVEQRLEITHEVVAHDATVAEIRRGLELREVLREVVQERDGSTAAADLRESYRQAMAKVGR